MDPLREGPQTFFVEMTRYLNYDPPDLNIRVGDTVVWRNYSDRTHTVTTDPRLAYMPAHADVPQGAQHFNSGFIPPGEQFSYTFKVPGTYRYFSIPFEISGMVGQIHVLPAE